MATTLPAIGSRYFSRETAMFATVVSTGSDASGETVDLLFENGVLISITLDDLQKIFDQIHQSSTGKIVLLEDERKSRDETPDQGEVE